MAIFNDDDLFIICRPGQQEGEPDHFKITYKDLKDAIIAEIVGGQASTTGEDTTTTETTDSSPTTY